MSPPESISPEALIEALREARSGPAVMAFDGDGTLWSGDVAEDVFLAAVDAGLMRSDAREPLRETAVRHGLDPAGSASELAGRIYAAFLAGRFPEREVCEVMTWCFAGWTIAELERYSRDTLTRLGLARRFNPALAPLLDWARGAEVRVVVVSASPQPIVEQAAFLRGISVENVSASKPALEGARVLPRMDGPAVYGPDKLGAAARFFRDGAQWLASFGDSPFDLELLGAARFGIAVRPKPELLARLGEVASSYVLGE